MQGGYKITYNVDIVFCIDATGSMENVLDIVKNNALNFYADVVESMRSKGKTINKMRLRVVVFRDYLADGDDAMLVTGFFELPQDAENFRLCMESIEAFGGGDDPEDGMEALAYAMVSDWNQEGFKKRHVIALWTDAAAHRIGYGDQAPAYPADMPKSFAELSTWWGAPGEPGAIMDQSAKRLLLFAPDDPSWNQVTENWDNVLHYPVALGEHLQELSYQIMINSISNTI